MTGRTGDTLLKGYYGRSQWAEGARLFIHQFPPLPFPAPQPRWAPPGGVASPGGAGLEGRRWVLRASSEQLSSVLQEGRGARCAYIVHQCVSAGGGV